MSLTEYEHETVINMNDADGTASVWTAQRKVISRLRKNPAAVLVAEGVHEGSVWAEFTIPAHLVSFRTVKVRPAFTPEQRQVMRDRMLKIRAAKAEAG